MIISKYWKAFIHTAIGIILCSEAYLFISECVLQRMIEKLFELFDVDKCEDNSTNSLF